MSNDGHLALDDEMVRWALSFVDAFGTQACVADEVLRDLERRGLQYAGVLSHEGAALLRRLGGHAGATGHVRRIRR